MLSDILYARLVYPLQPDIPAGTTQDEPVCLTLAHAEAIRVYHKTVELEIVLIILTCTAMTETYYKDCINPQTSTITEPLSIFILDFL